MSHRVVDTCVLMVADGRHPAAGEGCVEACQRALEQIRERHVTCVDSIGLIFEEYTANLGFEGRPGMGKAFVKWLWENQGYAQHCHRVDITDLGPEGRMFAEFPTDAGLCPFDRSDRKFVAVALTCHERPQVLNATDSDWWDHRETLRCNGVRIRFLCAEQFED